jgi:hypothetical protein
MLALVWMEATVQELGWVEGQLARRDGRDGEV